MELRRLLRRSGVSGLSAAARERLEWMLYAEKHHGNISTTCRHFGISRSTFRRWAQRFDPTDPHSVEDASKRPHALRQPETSERVIGLIERMRRVDPLCSKERIALCLMQEHSEKISPSTVGRIIARHKFFFADSPSHRRKRGVLPDESTPEDIQILPLFGLTS